MNVDEILNTLTIICSSEVAAVGIKKGLAGCGLNLESLQDTTIIAVENTLNGARMQSCTGIDIAHKLLITDPSKKIILYHVLQVEYIRLKKQNFDIVISKPNVRMLEMPFSPEALINVFNTNATETDVQSTQNALTGYIKGKLSEIWHDLKKASDPLNPQPGWQTEMVTSGFKNAKAAFPMLEDKENAFILKFLEDISKDREEVRKGENITGIFCDMEGTLFSDGILNNTLIEFLRKQELEGKKITLWTDGVISELQSLLDANTILYPLESKRDFAGAVVEIAIDDMDENSFSATTKIYAKRFIRIQDIESL